jgi:hypothetical protein
VVEAMAPPDAASNIKETINCHFIKISRSSDKRFRRLNNDKNIELPEDVDGICLRR